jgi:phage terminase small subunit
MARNRTPTSILEAKGSFVTHKNRQRVSEPDAKEPMCDPPDYLGKEEKKVWRDIVKHACPGVLFASDQDAFQLYVRLVAKMRYHFSEMSQFVSLASRFAATPADRSKVVVEKKKESSLSEFLNRKSA